MKNKDLFLLHLLMLVMIVLAFVKVDNMIKRDREQAQAEWKSIRRQLADEALMHFLEGSDNFVSEEALENGSPSLVERVYHKLD